MSTIHNFIYKTSKEKTAAIDPKLFDRTVEQSIADYIISGIKVIESLDSITLLRYKHITDASKIDLKLNRRHIKDKALLKDRDISKIVDIKPTAQEMLQMEFLIQYDGEYRYIKKNLLIPAFIDKYHLLINGNVALPQKQIVDMSTYVQGKSVKLKTTLTPIDIYKVKLKQELCSTSGESFNIETFVLNLFTKELNPLVYYFAKFGVSKTINYFSMNNIIDVTDKEYNTDINYYFKVEIAELGSSHVRRVSAAKLKEMRSKSAAKQKDLDINIRNLYIEVDKRFFNESSFVKSFVYMVYDIINAAAPKTKELDDVKYWTSKLGSIFTSNSKIFYNKGINVLISFNRILDETTKTTLRLDKKNLQSTHSLIRWVIVNHDELRRKDNHDFTLKRVRCNEVTAFYFIQAMAKRINILLNKKKLTIESIEKIFNWGPDELFKLILANKNNLLKYDPDVNCFDLLNALRYSFLGSQGIKGGKNIGTNFRDIYPSHIGRIDLNGISHGKNTALNGYLVPKCKIYDNGFFSEESKDPDNFNENMKKLKHKLKDKEIDLIKAEIEKLKHDSLIDEVIPLTVIDGVVHIGKRNDPPSKLYMNEDTGSAVIFPRNPSIDYVPTHRDKNGVRITLDRKVRIGKNNVIKESDDKIIHIKPTYTFIGGTKDQNDSDNNNIIDE